MKAIEQFFHVVLYIMLYKVDRNFSSMNKKTLRVTTQMKAIDQYFHVVLFIMLHNVATPLRLLMKSHSQCETIQIKALNYTCVIAYFSSLLVY